MESKGLEEGGTDPAGDRGAGAGEEARAPRSISETAAAHSRPEDLLEVLRVLADLGSDCAFVVRRDPGGRWIREWAGGSLPSLPGVEDVGAGPEAWQSFVLAEDREIAVAHVEKALARGASRAEYRIRVPGAETRWIESSLRSVREGERKDTIRLFGAIRDTTLRRSTEDALRKSEAQYRALVDQASDAIVVIDGEGRVLASNPVACDLFGLTREALHARSIFERAHPDDLERDRRALQDLDPAATLRVVRRVAGATGWVWVEISARRLQDGRIQAILRDITTRMEAEQRIRNLAYFDSLTGLPNRELFRQKLEQALEQCRRDDRQLALLFLDIDRFKQINDSLGHSSGDLLLQQVAERLRSILRGSDAVGRTLSEASKALHADDSGPVSRLGGDEFTILIPGLEHSQDAARVARRVLHALSRPYSIASQEVFAGGSIGLAVWPDDGETSEALLRAADTAMYAAKNRGGNVYEFFNATMNQSSTRRLELETRMRHALAREEFSLVYQPILDSRTGRVAAVEALLRWRDSDGQVVGPDEFIPIAEETGLIVELGHWALETACRQVRAWQRAGFDPLRLSVNVSVHQLRRLGMASRLEQVLFESGLPAECLELEITESSILDGDPTLIAAVGEISERGVGFALDDFGTGYSSLSALQRFPIDRLKIDRSFVAGVGCNRSDEALVSAIVALAKRLDLRVVAEGVETEPQARFLQALGCDELQGYLFGRPVEAGRFEGTLEASGPGVPERSTGGRREKPLESTTGPDGPGVAGPEGKR
ncbi:MAG: putative bifunctional diguanylate cyclase/phosphodiesterase [bacterium]